MDSYPLTRNCDMTYESRPTKINTYQAKWLEGEIWKPVNGYETLYHVSNMGRVKCLQKHGNRKERILKPWNDQYLKVCLWKNAIQKRHRIHRLVAEHFIVKPTGTKLEVNH